MINQFKMTSLPLLILLPPARIIQSRDLHPANHCWVFCISGARHPWETGHLYYARPTFCWDFDKTRHQPGFVWWRLGGVSDGPLYWEAVCWAWAWLSRSHVMFAGRLDRWSVKCRVQTDAEMSPDLSSWPTHGWIFYQLLLRNIRANFRLARATFWFLD